MPTKGRERRQSLDLRAGSDHENREEKPQETAGQACGRTPPLADTLRALKGLDREDSEGQALHRAYRLDVALFDGAHRYRTAAPYRTRHLSRDHRPEGP